MEERGRGKGGAAACGMPERTRTFLEMLGVTAVAGFASPTTSDRAFSWEGGQDKA